MFSLMTLELPHKDFLLSDVHIRDEVFGFENASNIIMRDYSVSIIKAHKEGFTCFR